MSRIGRLSRAFFTALRVTLRGQQAPVSPQAALTIWMNEAVRLADAALGAADANGFEQAARKAHTLAAEGRRISMETILTAVKFHAGEEYPHLMAQPAQTSISAIYATNLNDRFLVSKLFDTLEAGPLREAVGSLASHLEAIPSMPSS